LQELRENREINIQLEAAQPVCFNLGQTLMDGCSNVPTCSWIWTRGRLEMLKILV